MPEGRFRCKALCQCTAHQQIPRIGDQGDDCHLKIGGICHDQRKCGIFSCRGVVQQADKKPLKRRKARLARRNAQRKRYRKVAQRNGHAIPHSIAEHLAAELIRPSRLDELWLQKPLLRFHS